MEEPSSSTTNTERGNGGPINLPDELMRFIERDTYSLLIKGFAGTGKTTLALTILKTLGSKNNFFYISTRISPKQLFQYYPWLSKFVGLPKPSNRGEGQECNLSPSFEDARLDEPESLFERITNQLMDIASPIIIIDSWDAIASFMDKEARLNNERVLQTWRERAGAKLIFISEHPDDTTLDFLVDGIVELKQSYIESVRVREILLLKLRGVRIERSSYIYTLDNNVFRSFAPYRPIKFRPVPRRKFVVPLNDGIASADHVKSGFPALDASLGGGFPRKGVVLLELNSHVNTTVAMAFVERMISNFVSTGNPVVFQPFDWMDPQSVMNYVAPSIPSSKRDLFKILWTGKTMTGMIAADHNIILANKKTKKNGIPTVVALSKLRKKYHDKLLLNIMGTDLLQKFYGQREKKNILENMMAEMKSNADLSVVIGHSQHDVLEYLSEAADIHLRLLMISDTLFLQSLVPTTTLYAVVPSRHQITLEPVV
ncbi:MAG TPA: ATPase domain-containing protein [Nitrososphaera sp.]|nr:ATPase domain-containing protein [Nitrososphaera sp.]